MIKKWLNKNELIRNTFILVQGTVAAQLITILMQPILRRIFTTDDFGIFALYSSAVGVLAVVASGRYEMTIMLPKEDKNAIALFRITVLTSLIFNTLLFIVCLLLGDYFVKMILANDIVETQKVTNLNWLVYGFYILPVGVFIMSLFNAFNYLFTRKKIFKPLSWGRVVQTGTANGTQLGFGFMGQGFMGLLYGQIVGIFSAIVFWFFLKRRIFTSESGNLLDNLREYKDFPLKSVPSGLINMLALQLPNFLIAGFFGAGILGLYDVITRVMNLPMQMIGKSVSQVFYQKISTDIQEGNPIGPYVKKFSLKLLLFMAIPMTVIFFFGEPLFAFVFGEPYAVSGRLASYFSIFFLVRFVYYAQSTLYSSTRRLGIEFWQNSVFLIVQVSALLLGHYFFEDFEAAFLLLAAGGFICYTVFVFSLIRTANLVDR